MINQFQVRDLNIATIVAAALVGRPNEIAHITELDGMFRYDPAVLTADGSNIIAAANAGSWVRVQADLKDNFVAVLSPTATDDSTLGYAVGSHWIDTVTNASYICVDSTATTAIWKAATYTGALNNLVSIVAPTVTDDTSAGYSIGSMWYDSVANDLYMMKVSTLGAAVWVSVSEDSKNQYAAVISPTATDDVSLGYDVGSVWIVSGGQQAFLCVDSTITAAVWVPIDTPPMAKENIIAIVAPTVTDDASLGYSVNSIWIDTVLGTSYVCVDSTIGVAVWKQTSNENAIQDNYAAITAPAASDDATLGYAVGSSWIDTTNDRSYVCVDSTATIAKWKQLDATALNNMVGTVSPTVANDGSQGYSIGSMWYDSIGKDFYVCSDPTNGAAVWVIVSNDVKNNFIAVIAPTTTDDSSLGYSIGSVWVDTITDVSYTCVDDTVGVAVWTTGAVASLNNLVAIVAPVATDDSTAGYSVGSMWFDTVLDDMYIVTDVSVAAAIWVQVSNDSKNSYTLDTAPQVSDDNTLGYSVGSMWFGPTSTNIYVCISVATGAAVWIQINNNSSSLNNVTAIVIPTSTDDSSLGYTPSSLWYDTVTRALYYNTSATIGAAVWVVISDDVKNNFIATIAPTVGDDLSSGYTAGSLWMNTSTGAMSICSDATTGTAVWDIINAPVVKNAYNSFTVDPLPINDSSQGYLISSRIRNILTNEMFICMDNSVGAAIWAQVSSGTHHNPLATTLPTVADDSSKRYSVGSIWVNGTSGAALICTDATIGAAVWSNVANDPPAYDGNAINTMVYQTGNAVTPDATSALSVIGTFTANGVVNQPTGLVSPSTAGSLYKITLYSTVANVVVTFDPIYVDASNNPIGAVTIGNGETFTYTFRHATRAGLTKLIRTDDGASAKNNFAATAAPTGTDDSALGYSVGSVWIDITNDHNYTCVDDTVASAVWKAQPIAPISPRDVMQVKILGNNLFSAPNTSANMSTLVYSSGTGLSQATGSGIKGLKAGVAYKLTAVFWYPGNTAAASFYIRDVTANGLLNGLAVQMKMPEYGKTIETYFTPTVDTEVTLSTLTAGSVYLGGGSSLSVEEVVTFPASVAPLDVYNATRISGTKTNGIVIAATVGAFGHAIQLMGRPGMGNYDPSSLLNVAQDGVVIRTDGRYECNYSWDAAANAGEVLHLIKNAATQLVYGQAGLVAGQITTVYTVIFDAVAGDVIQLASDRGIGTYIEDLSLTIKQLPPYTSIAPTGPLPKYSYTPIGNTGRVSVSAGKVVLDGSGFASDGLVFDNTSMITSPTVITITASGDYLVSLSFRRGLTSANLQVAVNGVNKFRAASGGVTTETMASASGYLSLVAGDLITFTTGVTVLNSCSLLLAKQA